MFFCLLSIVNNIINYFNYSMINEKRLILLEVLPNTLPCVSEYIPKKFTLTDIKNNLVGTSYIKSKKFLLSKGIILLLPNEYCFYNGLTENIKIIRIETKDFVDFPTKNTIIKKIII